MKTPTVGVQSVAGIVLCEEKTGSIGVKSVIGVSRMFHMIPTCSMGVERSVKDGKPRND